METTLKDAYREVGQILELLGNEYKAKIPSKILTLFEQNAMEENDGKQAINDWVNKIKSGQIWKKLIGEIRRNKT